MSDWSWGDTPKLWLLCAVLLATATFAVAALRRFRRYRRSRIAKGALSAERAALLLLERRGYVVVDTQVRHVWSVLHGTQPMEFTLRADAIVRRGNRSYVAEVKSSAFVADLKHGPTRRQLLEYAIAYGTSGVLLVDMYAQNIEEVTFPALRRTERKLWSLLTACSVAFLLGAFLGLLGSTGVDAVGAFLGKGAVPKVHAMWQN